LFKVLALPLIPDKYHFQASYSGLFLHKIRSMTSTKMELMAPAGSYEALTAAIQGGANSIYFGVEQLNMRTKSTHNFGIEDLPKITHICQENGLKSYLTLNTIVYDHDLKLMQRICDAAKKAEYNCYYRFGSCGNELLSKNWNDHSYLNTNQCYQY
jgi:hypothetical protein